MTQTIATFGTLLAAIVTAVATFFLWRVTGILAVETKRMADVSAQPQVVATLVPNQWSTIHLDLNITNTGNATAFDIQVQFDPPLENGEARGDQFPIPFQKISVLKPGQQLQSYLRDVGNYLEKTFTVSVSWKLHPEHTQRQTLRYDLSMTDYKGVSYLGARDPLVQLADQIKKLREDWRNVARGSRRIKTEVFDATDRNQENEILKERRKREQGEG